VVDDAGGSTDNDIAAAEEDLSTDHASDSSDSETEEPVLDEPADPKEESSSATEVDDSVPEETINDSDEEDPETSTASNSSDDVANADTTDEEEPEALEDPEGKEP